MRKEGMSSPSFFAKNALIVLQIVIYLRTAVRLDPAHPAAQTRSDMKSRNRYLTLPFLAIAMLAGCPSCSGAGSAPHSPVMVRTDTILPSAHTPEALASLRPAIDAMAAIGILTDTTATAVDAYVNSRGFSYFQPDVEQFFTTGDSIDAVLGKMRDNMAMTLPHTRFPDIYAVISPYNQAIMTVDSVMLVALNHYLGSDYSAYGYFEPYIRRQKRAALLPYQAAEALVERDYPMVADSTATALNHILHDGAVTEAIMRSVPDASLADAGGWTADELAWLEANEATVWRELQERRLIYSKDRLDISRLLNPAPATMALNTNAPGRAGRYIGYKIVRSYLASHPEATIEDLLKPDFYNNPSSLPASGYRGR